MTEESFKRKLTAILSADVEGYSRLMGADELATIGTLKGYREEETRAEAAEVLRIHPKFSLEYASKTWPYKNQDDIDIVVNAMRKAGLPE